MTAIDLPLACTLIGPEKTDRLRGLAQLLSQRLGDVKHLEDGYELAYPGTETMIATVTEFITLERECCPFLTFELVLDPHSGPLTLRIHGPPGAKEFLRAEVAAVGGVFP